MKRFDIEYAENLSSEQKVKLNRANVLHDVTSITISQVQHVDKINYFDPSNFTKEQFVTECARGAYVTAVCRPDCTYAFSKLSQETNLYEKDAKELNNAIRTYREENKSRPRFVPLDVSNIELAVFFDAIFATNKDFTSQLGYVIT